MAFSQFKVAATYLAFMWLTILSIVALLLTLAYIGLVGWYTWGWRTLHAFQPDKTAFLPQTKVTIIIPARNEAANIDACLTGIVHQTYPKDLLQVIVVDDVSVDETIQKVQAYIRLYPFIEVLQLTEMDARSSHKKRAIEKAISHATGQMIVTTDADCTHQPFWIEMLAQRFQMGDVAFIAAPVVYKTESTLLSIFQSLDFATLQGITGASVSRQFHAMCNGANIAYSKKAFEEVDGFSGIDALPTGDDMLLMYKIFRKHPQGVCWLKNKEAIVSTLACPSWKEFINQRMRWASKAAWYDDRRIYSVLLLVYGYNLLFPILLVMAFFNAQYLLPLILSLLAKTIVELVFLWPVAGFFGLKKWLWSFPLLQPLHILYTVVAGWMGRFGSYQWKGRTIRTASLMDGRVPKH